MGGGGGGDVGGMIAANNQANAQEQAAINKYYGLEQNYLSEAQSELKQTLTPWANAGKAAYGAYNQAIGLPNLEGQYASNQSVLSRFENSPGYQAAFQTGMQALGYQQSQTGMTGSGAALKAAAQYGNNYASTGFQQYLSNLASSANAGGTMANSLATGNSAILTDQGSAAQGAGVNIANSISATQAMNSQLEAQSMAANASTTNGLLGAAGGILGSLF